MEDPLIDFLIGFIAFAIGLSLFFLRRIHGKEKFVDSMTTIFLIMAPTTLTIPLLAEHKGYIYFFLSIYLLAVNGWLFFAKNFIFGKIHWQEKTATYRAVLTLWSVLMIGFFVGSIVMVVIVPHIPKFSLP